MAVPETKNQPQPNALALVKKDTVDIVSAKIREFVEHGQLDLPAGYSVENAMKSAWLMLQQTVDAEKRPVLQSCTRDSVANALLDMAVQGLNPAKHQCYFIAYGNVLACQRGYFGDMAVAKMIRPDIEIYYGVVYKGDELEYAIERGRRRITKHVQKLENIKPEAITAAYCVIEGKDGEAIHTEIMTIDQIHKSWQQSKTYKDGGNGVHQKFTDQMCLRTVIRRTCKPIINSSNDDYLFAQAVRRSGELQAEAEIESEVEEKANGEVIDTEAKPVPAEFQVSETESESAPAPKTATSKTQEQAKQEQLRAPGF
ncbi:MAG: recombinase RecT [Bacillota bacterium]